MQYDREFSREYRSKEGEVVLLDVPILEIWPNFSTPSWRAYYIYYDNIGRKNTFYVKPVAPKDTKISKSFLNSFGECEREITRLNFYPKVFICEVGSGSSKLTAGLIFLKQTLTPPPAKEFWQVGIHFSSKMTNIFVREEGQEPFQIIFYERLMQVTASGAARVNVYRYFIQDDPERTTPFLNIYHDFQNRPTTQGWIEPILDGHVYFLLNVEEFWVRAPGMMDDFDLKWGSTAEERMRVRAFLEQLCLQCMAEAVLNGIKKISWRFSYPNTFSIPDKLAFQNLWEIICKNCTEKTGIGSIEEHPRGMSENIATANFFANYPEIKAKLGRGAVCILMGEKTTEIAIWQGAEIKLLWQTSLLYAEQDIFMELLRRKPEFLEKLGISGPEIEYLKTMKYAQEAFYTQVNAIISKKGAEMLKQLPIRGAESMVKDFINLIALGLAGLFHYIGLLLYELNRLGYYQLRMPNVFIGGNGSQMFHWLSGGSYTSDSPVNYLLKKILIQATGFQSTEKFEIQLSPRPEAEVAYGLVKSDLILMNYQDNLENQGVIAGEDFIVNAGVSQAAAASEVEGSSSVKPRGRKTKSASGIKSNSPQHPWNTILTTTMAFNGIQVSAKLEQLKTFLERYNQYAKKAGVTSVKFDDPFLVDIMDDLNQKLSQWTNKNEDTIKIEPLFIKGLKTFVEMKADEWARKYR
jgi:hypothetical protein